MNFNLTLLGQTISMIIFVAIAMKLWPRLIGKIDARRKIIADGIAAGEKGQRDLADARQGANAIMQDARHKAVQVVEIAHKRSNELVGEAKNVAVAEGERIVSAAHAEISSERTRARDNLRKEVAALALTGASKLLGREVDAKTHAALLDELAAELDKQAPSHG